MKKYLLLLLLPALAGCMSAEDKELRAALDMAGENRAELEHVLDYFASDSLKSRAARFLIANMPASYGYMPETQSELERVYQAYDSINRVYAYQTGEEWGKFRLPKVYRYTYSNHVEGPVADGRMRREDIPPLFRNIKKKDVSREYFTVKDVEVDLTAPIPSGVRYAYLAVFGYQQWHPVQWGKIQDGGKVVFKDMGMDMVYLPVYYMKGGVHPAGQVFKLDSEGRKHFLSDNGTRGKVRLRTVFGATSHGKNRKCLHSLRGARLYGLKDGIPAEELCQLTDSLGIGRNKFAISASSSFQHVRFVLPSDSLVAGEITFHTDQGIIRPVHVDTEIIPLSEGEDAGRLTDGDDATVARCRVPKGYVDFDLGTTCHLTGISVFPYLHSQLVQGDSYELRYWDGQWKTLESKQCADDGTIEFEGVPLNSLLMLKDLNWPGATAERIFMCRDGEVCWE